MDKAVLIDKVLTGIATEAEMYELKEWIESDPVRKAEFELIKAYNESIDAHFEKEYEELNGDGYWEFKERIQKAKERRRRIRSLKRLGASVVTSMLVVLVMGFIMNWPPFNADASYQLVLMEDTFYDASYDAIFNTLENKYGINIDVKFSGKITCAFLGGFSKGIKVENVVKELARSAGLQVTQLTSDHYLLRGVPCRNK